MLMLLLYYAGAKHQCMGTVLLPSLIIIILLNYHNKLYVICTIWNNIWKQWAVLCISVWNSTIVHCYHTVPLFIVPIQYQCSLFPYSTIVHCSHTVLLFIVPMPIIVTDIMIWYLKIICHIKALNHLFLLMLFVCISSDWSFSYRILNKEKRFLKCCEFHKFWFFVGN